MTAELLQTLSLAAYIVSGVFLLIGVAQFFLLDVPKLYGEVSGRTARKAIDNIRLRYEGSEEGADKPIRTKHEKRRSMDKTTQSHRYSTRDSTPNTHITTEKFATATLSPQSTLSVNETVFLPGAPFSGNETTVLTAETGDFILQFEMSFTAATEIIE